jgi:ferredoxin--NADP+ reductase
VAPTAEGETVAYVFTQNCCGRRDPLWDDFAAGLLDRVVEDRDALQALLIERGARPIPWRGWRAIDEEERVRGAVTSRPRVKIVAVAEMLSAAQPQSVPR